MTDNPAPPAGSRWVPRKQICAEEGAPYDGERTFPSRNVARWLAKGLLYEYRPTPGRVLVAVYSDGRPVWRGRPPRSVRPGGEIRARLSPNKVMGREYEAIQRELARPAVLWREAPSWFTLARHEFLRRKTGRDATERRLGAVHGWWPLRAPGGDGLPPEPDAWLAELAAMLRADGEAVPQPTDDRPAWIAAKLAVRVRSAPG
jgi:hypothetical protein